MPSLLTSLFMAAFFLESLAAILQNGFMVAVLGHGWLRGRVMPAGDMIVTCLAACRLGLHSTAVMNNLLVIFQLYHREYFFGILWDFSNTLTFWLTAWLSSFYCVKIASFSHPTFLWVRWRLSRSVPRLLLGSLAVSVLTSISMAIGNKIQVGTSQEPHSNGSWVASAWTFRWAFSLLRVLLSLSVPFLLFLTSTALLIFSLRRHLGQMRAGQHGSWDLSTQAHTVALKSLFFFLVFYSLYYVSLIVVITITPLQAHKYWLSQVVTYAGISLHSTILLLSSPRFKRILKRGATRCGGLDRGPVSPRGSDQKPVPD
ncbi:PREDICTED: taste receptor type 2 member 134-like [Elephantulus edwardii]|uniref:taste receptor type 2 member 134-like n=1 Tax=Elephantulus edwardii TaxID=28737 RepID=UPI0003F08619|nr:PREDICTED: taste receptor type 2 member 134-like [Elephantulus edwardii]